MQNNWSIAQTQKLFGYAEEAINKNKGLMWAFNKTSKEAGRSVNSVRNYYYSQLKMFELVPKLADDLNITLVKSGREQFELFEQSEIDSLVKKILVGKANGSSVRSTISVLAGGDTKLALRLQNKYRSMVTHHKDKVQAIMAELANTGTIFFNPYTKTLVTEATPDNHKKLTDYISGLSDTEAEGFLNIMKKLFA